MSGYPRMRGERGIVGVNLVVVIAFALYAVIQLSRTTLAARQIDERVRVIISEVGPGSNVSRLDETAKLDTIGKAAEDILAAARPLSGQAGEIITAARSIDNTVSSILSNANEINGTVKSINSTASSLLPTVRSIHDGVARINEQAADAAPVVGGIRTDLNTVFGNVGGAGPGGHGGNTIHADVNSINCASAALLAGATGCGT